MALDIITIYILGFNLENIDVPCIRVQRQYRDLQSGIILNIKDEFIEKLTYDACFVQVRRIKGSCQSTLDKLLSLFEQRYFVIKDNPSIKDYLLAEEVEDENIATMLQILVHAGASPDLRKELEEEEEAWRTINVMLGGTEGKLKMALLETKARLEVAETELTEKDKKLQAQQKLIEDLQKRLDS